MNSENIHRGIAKILRSIGYKENQSRVLAVLLISDRPLSLKEISDLTDYSISSISMSLDPLERDGLIGKFRKGRELMVVAEKDLRFILEKFMGRIRYELEKLEEELRMELKKIKKDRKIEERFFEIISAITESKEILK